MAVLGTDHHILVQVRLVHAAGQQVFLRQRRAALRGAGVAGTEGDVAGGILVKQGAVEQLAAAVDGAAGRHQRHLTDAAGTLVAIQQTAQQHLSLLGMVVHHTAFFKGDAEVFDKLAIEHIGLRAVDDALYPVFVRCSEHFFGRDVGQEHHAFFALAGGTLPHGPVGQTHGQVSAVAALEMHAFQIEGVHFVPQGRKTLHVGLPLVYRVAAGHAADIENELPQRLHGGVCIQLRENFLRPWYTRQGRNGPLHTVIHGVLLPGLHKGAAGRVHPADLIAVKARVQFRVVRDEVQHADAALALGIVQIAAQLPRPQVGQGFLAAQLHAGAGHSILRS